MEYRYYITKGQVTDTSYPDPKNNVLDEVCGFKEKRFVDDIEREAWGYVEYRKPLGYFDVINYGLVAVKTKTLHLRYIGRDSWGRYVYQDENGVLWKNTDCCSPRECCEERGDVLNSSSGNSFDGEPDCFMGSHIKVIYVENPDRYIEMVKSLVEEVRRIGRYNYNKEFVKVLADVGLTWEELVRLGIYDETMILDDEPDDIGKIIDDVFGAMDYDDVPGEMKEKHSAINEKELREYYSKAKELQGPPLEMNCLGVIFDTYHDITIYKDQEGNFWYSKYNVGD